MPQNRNKLIDLFISNISNAIVHRILSKSTNDEQIKKRYNAEFGVSLDISKNYRGKINPINNVLPEKDIDYIKNKIIKNVRAELISRISDGYKNINIDLIDIIVEEILKNNKII